MSSVPHFAVFIGTNGLFTRAWLLLISCHDNKLFYLQNCEACHCYKPHVHTAMGSWEFYS